MKKERISHSTYQAGTVFLFVLYAAALAKVLLIRNGSWAFFWTVSNAWKDVNFIPFHTIAEYLTTAEQKGLAGFGQMLANLLGNLLLFVPMGYLLPILSRKCQSLRRVVLISALCSLSVEVLQFFLQVGHSDIDDFLINTLGGLCGYWVLRHLAPRLPLKPNGYLRVAGLSAVLFCGGWIVAASLYHTQFGVSFF